VTSLDEYLAACREIFQGHKDYGAVTFKDQSAYSRTLDYSNPTHAEAEAVFNWFMEDPRRSAAYPDGIKSLDDFLFHEFMRMVRDLDLPVQIHTGHMAGIRNDIAKTNAVMLTKVIEMHRDVRFDLFHANWPYGGELLYMGKNYPNVSLDFCWTNIIDPIYSQNLFKQALSSVPHGKIHGYGSDFGGSVERAWAHADIARDNVAIALSDLVDIEYLDLDEAKAVAYDWLFGNANDFFRLGL
jgi:predicted TIM-barrel fold metal-dependent hydrolase